MALTMPRVRVHNEWDPLEAIIVGRIEHARVPAADRGLRAIEYPHLRPEDIPSGPLPPQVIDETAEDLQRLADALTHLGIEVHRPEPHDHARPFASPDWQSTGMASCCPRDLLLTVGDTILEAPMVLRARQYETLAYKQILLACFAAGARWLAAPRPRLLDTTYPGGPLAIADDEPLFDAANVLRLGRDLLYQVSDSGNRLGARWLQRTLGPDYRVHEVADLYDRMHIDTTLSLVRPGLLAVNAARVRRDRLPALFRGWDLLWVNNLAPSPCVGPPIASNWVGMNFLMLAPNLAVVDAIQLDLIRALERHQVDVLPLPLRHARTIGGGFHCVTLDLRRRGELASYCHPADPGLPP